MSKALTSASAQALPSRRRLCAAAPIAAMLLSPRKVAAEQAPLLDLIAAYEAALAEFSTICDFTDFIEQSDPAYVEMATKWQACSEAEARALMAVCAFQCRTLESTRIKAAFLESLLARGLVISDDHWSALLNSFLV